MMIINMVMLLGKMRMVEMVGNGAAASDDDEKDFDDNKMFVVR